MWEAQQEMLRARRGELGKDELKNKKSKKKAAFVSKSQTLNKADASTGKKDTEMYVDEGKQEGFKFPWQK